MSAVTLASPSESLADRAVDPDRRDDSTKRATDHQRALIVDNIGLVDHVLRYLTATWPSHVDRDDLFSAGQLALVECTERWDPDAGVPFPQYARQRIKGAMLDAVRDTDWAPRSLRDRVRRVEAARATFRQVHGREANHAEIAEATDLTPHQVTSALAGVQRARVHSIDTPTTAGDGTTFAELLLCPSTGAEQRVEDLEVRAELAGALAALDERARTIIVGIYLEGRPLADIGVQLGVTESRISQIHHETLRTLEGMLRRRWERDHDAAPAGGPERRARSYDASLARYRAWHGAQRGQLLTSEA
jgi:RNA polymerase sigma factor FliA